MTPSAWYSLTPTGDGSLRLQVTDSTPAGCAAVAGVAVANTWCALSLIVDGTVGATTLRGTLTDEADGNAKTIGLCNISKVWPPGGPALEFGAAGRKVSSTMSRLQA